jgi:zinc transporter, ZIP family
VVNSELAIALLYAGLAGIAIPVGGAIARFEHIKPDWLEDEFRHSVIAFGGGVLIAAVAFVLVPDGTKHVGTAVALLAFAVGGVTFYLVDKTIEERGASAGQLLAMLMDFLPESLALGAILVTDRSAGALLALLMALQNLPESFNSYREIRQNAKTGSKRILAAFGAIGLLGPVMALIGYVFLHSMQAVLGTIMLFAAGGILYVTFQDIAPQARRQHGGLPSLGAVAGFLLGLAGFLMLH